MTEMTMEKKKISVIVPCYNEEETLQAFYRETTKVLNTMEEITYELMFVDDGSADRTLEILRGLSEEDSRCHYISFSRNFGKEAGMYAGLKESTGDYCVIMDADLQHPPTLLPQMYRAVHEEGYDCCGGKRCGRDGDGILRSIFSRAFYHVSKGLTHMDMSDGYGDFRMMNRTMVEAILNMQEYNRYMKGIYSFVGFRTKWIEFQNVERQQGVSKWSIKSLFSYAMEGILAFSTTPLKLAGATGILLVMGAILYLIVSLVICGVKAQAVSGFSVLLSVVLLLAGVQMLFLYIIGAYLSKDYMENKKRPLYIVREER